MAKTDIERLQYAYLDVYINSNTAPDINKVAKKAKVDISEWDPTQLTQQLRMFDGILNDLFGATILSLKEDLMIMEPKEKIAFIKAIADIQRPQQQQQININNILTDHWR